MAAFSEYVCGRYVPRTAEQLVATVDSTPAVRLAVVLFNKQVITAEEFRDVVRPSGEFAVGDEFVLEGE